MNKYKDFIPILLSIIIIVGLLFLTQFNYLIQKNKINKKETNIKDELDKQLNKSEKELTKTVNRYKKIKNLLKDIETKTKVKLTESNYETGIDREQPNKGLDRRLNIHINLDNPEERDFLGM